VARREENKTQKKEYQNECGTITGKLCSDLFKERYDIGRIRQLIRSLSREDISSIQGATDEKSLEREARHCSRRILKTLKANEERAEANNVKYVVEDIDRFVHSMVRDYLKEDRKSNKEPECGTSTGIPCSQLFEQTYREVYEPPYEYLSFGKIKDVIVSLIKGKYFQFHEEFDEWPRDDEGRLDERTLSNYSQGLFAYIKGELVKREENARKRNDTDDIDSLDNYVRSIVVNWFLAATEKQRGVKKGGRLVAQDDVETIRVWLGNPQLTLEDLKILAEKLLTPETERLRSHIRRIPGYRKVWFSLRKDKKGQQRLYIHETYQDRVERVEFLTRTRRDDGGRWIRRKATTESFNYHDFTFDGKKGKLREIGTITLKDIAKDD
jgi:hypothetical protein